MAKLTRTQKYADLRSDLANNKEATNTTQELNGYVDRFNNVQNNLAPEAPRRPVTEPEYSWQPEARPTPQQPQYNYQQEAKPVETVQFTWQQQQVQQAQYQQQPVQQPQYQQQPVNNNQSSYFDSFMNAPVSQQPQDNRSDYDSFFRDNNSDLGTNYRGVFNDVNDATDNTISRKERDTYLNQTISDVNFHNIVNGEKTLNQIIDNTVNEVRHAEPVRPAYSEPEVEDNTYAWNRQAPLDADAINVNNIKEEDFSNTVSMEISKIIGSVDMPKAAPVQQPQYQQPAQQINVAPTPVQQVRIEPAPVQAPIMQTRQENVVEIKNISEIKDEPMKNTISGTIPFVVAAEGEEDIEDDEEDEGSNTILNIILIVLIIVLMAVLGLIVFYILKTKGIF